LPWQITQLAPAAWRSFLMSAGRTPPLVQRGKARRGFDAAHEAKVICRTRAIRERDQEVEILRFGGPVAQRVWKIDA
jgi:hypothetical protein